MSTCAGAPAPHLDCPHGERCDWSPATKDEIAESLRHRTGRAAAELMARVRTAGAARKVRTPERALATIEKLETADLDPIGTRVYVWPEPRGRVTGFFVGCESCGAMPFLAPTKAKAHVAAARHVKAEHRSRGTVVLRERPLAVGVSG